MTPVDVATSSDVRRSRRVREDPDAGAAAAHRPHDVRLEPEVDDPDPAGRRRRGGSILGDRPAARPGRRSPGPPSAGRRARRPRGRAASTSPGAVTMPAQAAVRAQVAGERARVDAGDGRDAVVAQQRRQLAGAVEDRGRRVGHDQRPQPRADRLVVVGQPAVVADQRIGHDDDLAGVRGVGADLLVAGLARVHDEVATRRRRARRTRRRERPCRPRAPAARARGPRSADRRSRWRAAAVGRSRDGGPRIQRTHPPRGRGGRGRARSSSLLPGLTGPVRRPHRTGHERTAQGSTHDPGRLGQEPRPETGRGS